MQSSRILLNAHWHRSRNSTVGFSYNTSFPESRYAFLVTHPQFVAVLTNVDKELK